MLRNKILIALFSICALCSLGYASWNFSESTNITNTANLVIHAFDFQPEWIKSDVLEEEKPEAYEAATEFEEAINNPTSDEGSAWTEAWKSKHSSLGGNQYVGSMDRNAGEYIDLIFDDNANYIITTVPNSNEYFLYVTYEKLNTPFGTVQPVYKTQYQLQSDGTYRPIESWIGKCNRNIYSIFQITTFAFDTTSFVEI